MTVIETMRHQEPDADELRRFIAHGLDWHLRDSESQAVVKDQDGHVLTGARYERETAADGTTIVTLVLRF